MKGALPAFELAGRDGWLLLPDTGAMAMSGIDVPRPVTVIDLLTGIVGPESDVARNEIKGPALLISN